MATEIDPTQVETAPASPDPATAPAAPESSAAATPPTSTQQTAAEARAELTALYDSPAVAEPADAGKTEELAPAETVAEPPPVKEESVPQEKAAEDEPEIPGQLRPRIKDEKDIALHIFAKAHGLTVMEAARRMLATEPKESIPGVEAPAEPTGAQQIESEIDALAAEIEVDRQGDGQFLPEHSKRLQRLASLEIKLGFEKLKEDQQVREAQARVTAQAQTETERLTAAQDECAGQVRKDFPSINDEDSDLYQQAEKVRLRMMAEGDPHLNAPDLARYVIERAADELATRLERRNGTPKAQTLATLKAQPASPPTAKAPTPLSSPSPAASVARRVIPAPGFRGQTTGDQPSPLMDAVSTNTASGMNDLLKQHAERKARTA